MHGITTRQYQEHWKRLTWRAMRMGCSRQEGEELAQEALYAAVLTVPHLEGGDFRAWTTTALRNRALNATRTSAHRAMKYSLPLDDLESLNLEPGRAPNQDQVVFLKQALKVLATLPDRARRLVTLIAIEGRSYSEVSEIVGLPLGTVKSALFRAQADIRSRLLDGACFDRREASRRAYASSASDAS